MQNKCPANVHKNDESEFKSWLDEMSTRAVSFNLETNWSVNIALRVYHVTPPDFE